MTALVEPTVLDPIGQVLSDLSICLCAQILTDGLPPTCVCGVAPGGEVALDHVGDCKEACGQAWVRLATAYPSTSVGQPATQPGNCQAGIGLEVEVGIVRCMDVGDGTEPPSLQSLQESALLQSADLMAMWRAITCCRQSKDWIIGQYQPLGPEGGMVGGILTVGILLL